MIESTCIFVSIGRTSDSVSKRFTVITKVVEGYVQLLNRHGLDTNRIDKRFGKIRIQLRIFHPCLIFDNYQNLAADLPGPVKNIRTGTDITDKIGTGQIRKLDLQRQQRT